MKESGEKHDHTAKKRKPKKKKVLKIDAHEMDEEVAEVKHKPRRKHRSRDKERTKG